MRPDFIFSDLFLWRLLSALALIAAGLLAYRLVNYLTLSRARGRSAAFETPSLGMPVLLYFTTPTCAPCRNVQRPAIQRLQERVGDRLQVIEVDAAASPELASRWGVLSVPTTFVIDSNGRPRHVNHGVTSAEKLLDQFAEIA